MLRRQVCGLLRTKERGLAREDDRGLLRTEDRKQVRVLLQSDEPRLEQRLFRSQQ